MRITKHMMPLVVQLFSQGTACTLWAALSHSCSCESSAIGASGSGWCRSRVGAASSTSSVALWRMLLAVVGHAQRCRAFHAGLGVVCVCCVLFSAAETAVAHEPSNSKVACSTCGCELCAAPLLLWFQCSGASTGMLCLCAAVSFVLQLCLVLLPC